MAQHTILILGGGVGGTLTANLLAHRLTRKQARIILVDRSGWHSFQPSWLNVPFGGEPPEKYERAERQLLDRMVELVIADVAHVLPEEHRVELVDGARLQYDTLVIATGATMAPEVLPGFAEGAQHFYNAEAALQLHATLRAFQGGPVVVGVSELPVKAPPAPIEFAFLLDKELRRRGLREQSPITFVAPDQLLFPPYASVADFVLTLFAERGIVADLSFAPAAIDPERRVLRSHGRQELPYALLVLAPPQRGAAFISASGLGDAQGWVPTDRETLQALAHPDIYVIGDANDLPVAKSGAAAHFEARVVARRIIGAVRGQPDDSRYNGQVMCFLETGNNQATQLIFDYTRPPQPPAPNAYFHYEKALLNRAYWHLVPTGVL
jgi:sulfide:quinone oxidoreductase